MKCPDCRNDLGRGQASERCECGWKLRVADRTKRCTADGPRNLQTFMSSSMSFRLQWAAEHGLYRDGGPSDQGEDSEDDD